MVNLLIEDMGKDPRSRSIGRIITAIARYGKIRLTSELKDYDLMGIPIYILHSLSKDKLIKQEDLIMQHGVDKAVMTRSLNKLQRRHYIEKIQDPEDRRAYLVRLTEKGGFLKDQTRTILYNFNDKILSGFSDDEIIQLFGYLDRLLTNAIKALEE
ncbi:MAG: winged helix DNA-binding protein [Candidatus Methanofastidiosa archaeon]|nr:winged helix DNA-binding protein [Candidatus Methanofastidiosa archaeon]